jgi:N6-L-threonylcarbamoyladenine synthase
MKILAIETSCDETAIAIVDVDGEMRFTTLANEILSQASLHSEYGGVFPMMAKREHARTIVPLLIHALKRAGLYQTSGNALSEEKKENILTLLFRELELGEVFIKELSSVARPDIERIVVTQGPGLEPALWVGINVAKALGELWDIPVEPVNHMEGHILSAVFDKEKGILPTLQFPVVALLISGGHTELVRMDAVGSYTLLGETQDDAVGECFDKVARMLGLPYPGGPEISRMALLGKPGVYTLPRPMVHSGNLNFSFSGLKTAVLYMVKKLGTLTEEMKANIAREFEDAVVEVLVSKSQKAIRDVGAHALVVGGGVSANTRIREALKMLCAKEGIALYVPDRVLSTDNAFMIALSGAGKNMLTKEPIVARGNWKIHS